MITGTKSPVIDYFYFTRPRYDSQEKQEKLKKFCRVGKDVIILVGKFAFWRFVFFVTVDETVLKQTGCTAARKEKLQMNRIILGNLISFLASIALTAGCLMKDPKKVYVMQVTENLILVVSSACFASWSGISTLLVSTVRNILLVKGTFDKRMMYLFMVLVTGCGLAVNNKELIGLLPVLATVILTVCNYYAKEILAIKWSLFVNIMLWAVYFFAILDVISGITQIVIAAVTLASIVQLHIEKKQSRRKETGLRITQTAGDNIEHK